MSDTKHQCRDCLDFHHHARHAWCSYPPPEFGPLPLAVKVHISCRPANPSATGCPVWREKS